MLLISVECLLVKSIHFYFDNYFSSVGLQKKLLADGSDWHVSKNRLGYLKWIDKNWFHFLKQYAGRRMKRGRCILPKNCGKKLWHCIFFYFIDVSWVSSLIWFKIKSSSAQIMKYFRMFVVLRLVGAAQNTVERRRPSKSKTISRGRFRMKLCMFYCTHMLVHSKHRTYVLYSTKAESHKSRCWSYVWKVLCLKFS